MADPCDHTRPSDKNTVVPDLDFCCLKEFPHSGEYSAFVITEIICMPRYLGLIIILIVHHTVNAQRLVNQNEAINLSLNNQRNLKPASLLVQQQNQLLKGSAALESPQLQYQVSPYDEGAQVGVQQTISFPSVYRNRKALQNERLRLAQLQLQGSQYDLKREVRLNYLQLQYLSERRTLLLHQDSIYQNIKSSAKRFFDAGQLNKLEELQAATQADQVRNELNRIQSDLLSETQIFRFFTALEDSFLVEPMSSEVFLPIVDTITANIQLQILQQQTAINQRELGLVRSELLPELQAGVLFPTVRASERKMGFQFGLTIPIWRKQNRGRVEAAETGIQVAQAQQTLEQQRLTARYKQAAFNYERELQSLNYFNSTALPQARAIIETSQRLFQGGELNYIESLRNLQMAFDIFFNNLDTRKAYNEAVIQLNFLNGTL